MQDLAMWTRSSFIILSAAIGCRSFIDDCTRAPYAYPLRREPLPLFPYGQEQPVSNISQPRPYHTLHVYLPIYGSHPDLYILATVLLCRPPHTLITAQYTDHNYLLHSPFQQRLYSGTRCPASRDDWIEQDGDMRYWERIWIDSRGPVVRQVVIVFDGL